MLGEGQFCLLGVTVLQIPDTFASNFEPVWFASLQGGEAKPHCFFTNVGLRFWVIIFTHCPPVLVDQK